MIICLNWLLQRITFDSMQKVFIKYISLFYKITPTLFKFLVGPLIGAAEGEDCRIFQINIKIQFYRKVYNKKYP